MFEGAGLQRDPMRALKQVSRLLATKTSGLGETPFRDVMTAARSDGILKLRLSLFFFNAICLCVCVCVVNSC